MKRGGVGSTGVNLISGRGGDMPSSESRSNTQRGSRSGGGESTFNVYSHLGQEAVEDPYSKDGPMIVAPRNFYGATDPMNHSRSAGGRSGDGSRDSNSRRSFASAGAQAIDGGGSPQVSSRRCRSWGGGTSSSVGAALAWGTPTGNNQVATSDSFYRRNRGEGQVPERESNSSADATSARLSYDDRGRYIPGLEGPYPAHAPPAAESNRVNKFGGYEKKHYDHNDNTFAALSYPSHAKLPDSPTTVPMSHGGLTSSSTYGSGYATESASTREDSHQQGFGGFGGRFGERSLLSGTTGANRGKTRGGGGGVGRGLPPGYAPSSGGRMEAALSSNVFASGHSQNCGNVITGRPSSRVTAPPGGHSTFSLG